MSNLNTTRTTTAVLDQPSTPIFDELTEHFFTTPVDTAYFFTTPTKSDYVEAQVVDVHDTEVIEDEIVDGPTGAETWLWIIALGAVLAAITFLYIIGATGRIA